MIGDKIRQLLKLHGIKQTQLAQHLEISTSRLSNYLSNNREPDLNILSKIAKYLSTDLNYFSDIDFNNTKNISYKTAAIDINAAEENRMEYKEDEMIKVPFKSLSSKTIKKSCNNYRYIHKELLKNVRNPLANSTMFEVNSSMKEEGVFRGDYILAAKFNSILKKNGLTVFEIDKNIEYYKYIENKKTRALVSIDNKNIIFIDKDVDMDNFYIILWIFKKNY